MRGSLNIQHFHPTLPQIQRVSRRHCAFYKCIHLLTYLHSGEAPQQTITG